MRIILGVMAILFIIAVIATVLDPPSKPAPAMKLNPVDEPNYWISKQDGIPIRKITITRYIDDPSEAWHNADEVGDSDDPEIYNDVHED